MAMVTVARRRDDIISARYAVFKLLYKYKADEKSDIIMIEDQKD